MTAPNFRNRTLWTRDNLDVLRGLNSECVDLFYLDPPFNSNKTYEAPIGSKAAGAAFKDAWTLSDVDEAWHGEVADRSPALYEVIRAGRAASGSSMMSYLIMMSVRLIEIRRALKSSGSIYLHCDPTASHYLKMLMDVIFGPKFFRNEIIWAYTGPSNTKRWFPRKHDVILFYSKSQDSFFDLDAVRIAYSAETLARRGRREGRQSIISASAETQERRTDQEVTKKFGRGKAPEDWWVGIPSLTNQLEKTGYPTQKPLALLDRVIKASCPPDGLVFDPFCGCATTLVAAERAGRRWGGVDVSPLAVKLVKQRLQSEMGMFYDVTARTDIPVRTDLGRLPNYRTHKHTLYGRQEGVCRGCSEWMPFKNLTIDHVVPRSRGGTDHFDNLQLLCGWCNSTKGDGTMAEFKVKMAARGY